MRFWAVIIFLLLGLSPTAAFCGDCGKKSSEIPANSSTSEYIDAGQVKSLRGRVLYPDGKEAELVIVEVYRNDLAIPTKEITYSEASEILKNKRLAGRDTRISGKFCFKKLPAGNYMLRVNTTGKNSQFSTMYVFVTFAPKNEKNISRKLEIRFEFAI